jgi:hypothetical protein
MDGPPAPEREPMAPPHQLPNAPVPPQPQWAYQPAPRPAVRPIWIIAAGIIIAVAVIIAAIIISHGNTTTQSTPTAAPTQSNASQSANLSTASAATSSTCTGWRAVSPSISEIVPLPDGWDYDTPNIDQYINDHNASVIKLMDIFEPLISDEPADVAKIAHTFVDSRRNEAKLLAAHTYRGSDGAAGNVAATQLDQLCGADTK